MMMMAVPEGEDRIRVFLLKEFFSSPTTLKAKIVFSAAWI